jgi:uncharacterized membrane protein YqgA involved in biofilm formation
VKDGAIDGLNLFFGALLGANLGTLTGLRLVDYVQLATMLAVAVLALRMASATEKRGKMAVVLAACAGVLVALALLPTARPQGMSAEDMNRLVATLGVWLVFVSVLELSPAKDAKENPPSI